MSEWEGPPRFEGGESARAEGPPPRFPSESPPAPAVPEPAAAIPTHTSAPVTPGLTPPNEMTQSELSQVTHAKVSEAKLSRRSQRTIRKEERRANRKRTASFRAARRVSWLLGSIALVSAGAAAMWWFNELREPEVSITNVTAVVDRPVIVQQVATRGSGRMPDLVGLSGDQAQQVLVDAGLLPEQVEQVEQASARPTGEVLGQDPAPGIGLPGVVTIWTSVPAQMPDLTGQSLEEARNELQSLGARILIERRFVVGVDPEQIVESNPPAGQALVGEAQLVVSSPGSSVFAAELRSQSSSDCSFSDATIGSMTFDRAIVCDPDREDIPHLEYLVGPETATVEGTLGRTLRSDLGVSMEVRIFADTRLVFQEQIAGTEAVEFEVDVSNSSRVRFELERIDARDESGNVFLGFGDVRFTGSNSSIDVIRAENS